MTDESPKIDLSEEQRTEIVAYLDGELDTAEAERIRKLMAENIEARRAAEQHTMVWEALESLEGVKASGDFATRTLTSIEALAETETIGSATQSLNLRRGGIVSGWILGILASGGIGFCITNWAVPEKSQRMVRDLELMKSLPKYERVQDVEVLQRIKELELFDDQ